MNWQVIWTPHALKELALLGRVEQNRVREAVERFASGGVGDVKRLQGYTPPQYRLRVAKWRVRFRFDHASGTIHILHVLRRDEAY